ncbi:MAG: small metal-binding protein SmbP [Methylococcus sp.]
MKAQFQRNGVLALLLMLTGWGPVVAEEHADEALRHARQAAESIGDSAAIRQHADEALKHMDAAKVANQANPRALKHLQHGETDLNDAVSHARHFNSQSAADEAGDASRHLQQAQPPAAAPRDR